MSGNRVYVAGMEVEARGLNAGESLATALVETLTNLALHGAHEATKLHATIALLGMMEPPTKEPGRAICRQGEAAES